MAKKKKKFQETTIENFYDLRVDKVDELVAALKDDGSDGEEISMNVADCTGVYDSSSYTRSGKQKQFNPYKTDFLGRVPTWLKAVFVKWWFAGAVCFFIMMGLSLNALDQMILCGVVMGMVVDILVNPLFGYMECDPGEYNSYMMFPFPFRAFWTFFANIVYYVCVILCVNLAYIGINTLLKSHSVWLEPLLFGTICVIVDMAFIGIKDGAVALVKKLRKKEKDANV